MHGSNSGHSYGREIRETSLPRILISIKITARTGSYHPLQCVLALRCYPSTPAFSSSPLQLPVALYDLSVTWPWDTFTMILIMQNRAQYSSLHWETYCSTGSISVKTTLPQHPRSQEKSYGKPQQKNSLSKTGYVRVCHSLLCIRTIRIIQWSDLSRCLALETLSISSTVRFQNLYCACGLLLKGVLWKNGF